MFQLEVASSNVIMHARYVAYRCYGMKTGNFRSFFYFLMS